MSVEVSCPCGHIFPVEENFIGGMVNCPRCGHAVEVPGLRDAAWTALVVLAFLIWGAAGALAWWLAGPLTGIIVGVVVAAALWLISRGF